MFLARPIGGLVKVSTLQMGFVLARPAFIAGREKQTAHLARNNRVASPPESARHASGLTRSNKTGIDPHAGN